MKNNEIKERNPNKVIAFLFVMLLITAFLSFLIGRYGVPAIQAIKILLSTFMPIEQTWSDNMAISVLNVRLPRIVLACLVGSCLSLAGTSYQSVFKNPMAAPDILGASSGACFGAALAILLGFSGMWLTISAFSFSIICIILVYIIGSRTRGNQIVNILLAGIMVGSIFTAGTSFVKLVADPSNQLPAITYWLMGSLSGTDMRDVGFAVIPMLIGIIPLFINRWKMNILTLGDEEARSLGVNTSGLRIIVIVGATFITAASVAVSGMIGWVGLVIPHLSRRLIGSDNRYLIPASMLFGAIFLLLVDNVSRNLLATEIPIGILTAFIGAPFFIYLMIGKENG